MEGPAHAIFLCSLSVVSGIHQMCLLACMSISAASTDSAGAAIRHEAVRPFVAVAAALNIIRDKRHQTTVAKTTPTKAPFWILHVHIYWCYG